MRYDRNITLIQAGSGERYDPVTGRTIRDPDTRTKRLANITEAGIRTALEVYGDARTEALVCRIRGNYSRRIDRVEIDGQVYTPTLTRRTRHHTAVYITKEATG